MTLTKSHTTAAITAIILVIATATATTSFSNTTTAFATILGSEQLDDNATTGTTTTTPGAAEGGQQQQQQTVHITKHSTNSYVISGGSSSVGSFDTTYRIVGERSAVRTAENLIISTITDDFRNSPIIGYVGTGTTTGADAQDTTTLPNPFASPEQITERIRSELRRVIGEAENNTAQGQLVDIKCDFGMTLEEMHCHHNRLVGGEAGGSEGTTPTNTTGTTTDTTAPLAP